MPEREIARKKEKILKEAMLI